MTRNGTSSLAFCSVANRVSIAPVDNRLRIQGEGTLVVIDLPREASKSPRCSNICPDNGCPSQVLGDLPAYELRGETERGDFVYFLQVAAINDMYVPPDL